MDNIEKLKSQLARKEQECEELRKKLMKKDEIITFFNTPIEGWSNDPCEICKYKQTLLTEIKPILEFYANSNMGEEQPDRTYKIVLNGSYITVYDPKPARQALQKISKCEDE